MVACWPPVPVRTPLREPTFSRASGGDNNTAAAATNRTEATPEQQAKG
jgi:hypothetical protein